MRSLVVSVLWLTACFGPKATESDGGVGSDADAARAGDAAADLGDGSQCEFPFPRSAPWNENIPTADRCPKGCLAIAATELDMTGTCARRVMLGCLPCSTGCGGRPESYQCTKYVPDGRLLWSYRGFATDGNPDFVQCTPEEYERIRGKDLDVCAP